MVNKTKKKFLISSRSMIFMLTISLVGLSGCSINETPTESVSANPVVSVEKDADNGNTQNAVINAPAVSKSIPQSTPTGSNEESEIGNLTSYIGMLGLDKNELTETLNEEPGSVDEGGLEFKKAGIRIWFDTKSGTANQIFTQNESIDLDGVKIGDKIDKFIEAFGSPVSDNNGDIHFKYGDVFLSVNYDTTTEETFALYILVKDF